MQALEIYVIMSIPCLKFTHHVHDLHEAEAEIDGESVRVIEDRSLQWVVVPHQVAVQPVLMFPLMRNYEGKRQAAQNACYLQGSHGHDISGKVLKLENTISSTGNVLE